MADSEYFKWRTLIGLAHVDKRLMKEEKEFLTNKIKELAPPAMHFQLMSEMAEDVVNPKPIDMLFEMIHDPPDRVEALVLAYQLFCSDDDLDDREQEAFQYMKNYVMNDPETDGLMKELIEEMAGDPDRRAFVAFFHAL